MDMTRMIKFGSGSTILRSKIALDDSQIQAAAPSVFVQEAHGSRSGRYTHIPTSEVLKGLRKEGFQPYEVRQGGSRDEAKRGFTKHLIRFRHESEGELIAGDSIREIVLLNSHDGTSSYQLMSGVFRVICSNGLIVGDDLDVLKIHHKGDVVNKVIEGAYSVIENNKEVISTINQMREMQLLPSEQFLFAESALMLRPQNENSKISVSEVMRPRRKEDKAEDLWTTFNRVQENMISGGMHYTHTSSNGRTTSRRTQPTNGINGNISLNRALWNLASGLQKLKAA